MHIAEKFCFAVRHNKYVEDAGWLWNGLRPLYDQITAFTGRHGLERIINGTDRIKIASSLRAISETYEPEVWRSLMNELKPGDVVADVGAYVGLYTIALAKRVGEIGYVVSFEPDSFNGALLKKHLKLNHVESKVKLIEAAAGDQHGEVYFTSRLDTSHVSTQSKEEAAHDDLKLVPCVTLDQVFAGQHLDLLKIDVEGYEEKVLRGASDLLGDEKRSPRAIYIEVHPYAWSQTESSSETLLGFLTKKNYRIVNLQGEPVSRVDEYGEIVAQKNMV